MSTTVTPPRTSEVPDLRRAGWWMIAGFLAFLIGLVVTIVVGSAVGAEQAVAEAADRLGVPVDALPPEVVAAAWGNPGWLETILQALPLVLAPLLLLAGVRLAAGRALDRHRVLARTAVGLAAACALVWIGVQVESALVVVEALPLLALDYPLVTLTSAFGGAALVALVVVLRARGHVRRTGLAVGVLGTLTTLACFVMPPFMPLVLALVLGVALVRTRPSATM